MFALSPRSPLASPSATVASPSSVTPSPSPSPSSSLSPSITSPLSQSAEKSKISPYESTDITYVYVDGMGIGHVESEELSSVSHHSSPSLSPPTVCVTFPWSRMYLPLSSLHRRINVVISTFNIPQKSDKLLNEAKVSAAVSAAAATAATAKSYDSISKTKKEGAKMDASQLHSKIDDMKKKKEQREKELKEKTEKETKEAKESKESKEEKDKIATNSTAATTTSTPTTTTAASSTTASTSPSIVSPSSPTSSVVSSDNNSNSDTKEIAKSNVTETKSADPSAATSTASPSSSFTSSPSFSPVFAISDHSVSPTATSLSVSSSSSPSSSLWSSSPSDIFSSFTFTPSAAASAIGDNNAANATHINANTNTAAFSSSSSVTLSPSPSVISSSSPSSSASASLSSPSSSSLSASPSSASSPISPVSGMILVEIDAYESEKLQDPVDKEKKEKEKEKEKKNPFLHLTPPLFFEFSVSLSSLIHSSITQHIINVYKQYGCEVTAEELRLVHSGKEVDLKTKSTLVSQIKLSNPIAAAAAGGENKSNPTHSNSHSDSLIPKDSSSSSSSSSSSPSSPPLPTFRFLLIFELLSRFFLDPLSAPPSLIVSSDCFSVSTTSDSKWSSVRSTLPFTHGRHSWKVRMTTCTSGNVFVGVVSSVAPMTNYIGHDANGMGYYGCGSLYRSGAAKSFGTSFRTGDVITCSLDMDKRQLYFKKNEENYGLAFEDLPTELYPSVSLFTRNDEVIITDFAPW